jgi:lactoylglutathione lyase
MPQFKKLTPNLVVSNVQRSLAFYTDVLGFARGMAVPEQPPFVFASVTSGSVEVFLNDAAAVLKDHPDWAAKLKPSAANSMFIEIEGPSSGEIDALHDRIKASAKIVMPLTTQWYGMREFAIEDVDGYVITFAERVEQR